MYRSRRTSTLHSSILSRDDGVELVSATSVLKGGHTELETLLLNENKRLKVDKAMAKAENAMAKAENATLKTNMAKMKAKLNSLGVLNFSWRTLFLLKKQIYRVCLN